MILLLDCFQTLYSISSEKNHTIVFPLPIDVIGSLMGGGQANDKNGTKTILDIEAEKKSVWTVSYFSQALNFLWWMWLKIILAYAVEKHLSSKSYQQFQNKTFSLEFRSEPLCTILACLTSHFTDWKLSRQVFFWTLLETHNLNSYIN